MIVLDTHVWLWWASDAARLSALARQTIDEADEIGVSAISAWEIGMLADRGRIGLDPPAPRWVRVALSADPRTIELPLTSRIAVSASGLGATGMHGDPADRFIYATAREYGAKLVTRDAALRAYDAARTVW